MNSIFTKDEKAFCYMLNQYLTMYELGNRQVTDDIVECTTHLLTLLLDKGMLQLEPQAPNRKQPLHT